MTLTKGIYTLANDLVYDQVIALVNSIRKNYDSDIPICIIPYNAQIQKLKTLYLEQVFLFDNPNSLSKWQNFASSIWNHERFAMRGKQTAWYHGSNTIRKLCSFDGPFDQFIYIDSDSLVMSSLEDCFNKLNEYECIFNDWEHKKENSFLSIDLIEEKYQYKEKEIKVHCHCSDFFASKSSLITDQLLDEIKFNLLNGEVNFINERGWWDEVYLFSYITFKLNCKVFNYTLSINPKERTGNIAKVDPFVEKDYVLFNQEGLKPIQRIHYMGYGSEAFTRLCKGEDTNIPHQQVFLHYRFMNNPEQAPTNLKKASFVVRLYRWMKKAFYKFKEYRKAFFKDS